MIRSEKKIKDLTEILNGDNYIAITGVIEMLRQEAPFEGAIGLLTACYDNTDDFLIRKTIESFMNDLKDPSASKEVICEIRKPWKTDTISMLVSSCWQSGINYSEYTLDLAKIFLTGDYVTAVECLTVIEESVQELSKAKREELIKLIKENAFPPADEKSTLTLELLSILRK
jgi:hypothetical protein